MEAGRRSTWTGRARHLCGALAGLALGCAPAPPTAPGPRLQVGAARPLGPASFVGAADLDGDGSDELFFAEGGSLRWRLGGADQQAPLDGVVSAVAPLPDALLLATGIGRGAVDAPARLLRVDRAGLTELWRGGGARPQVTELRVRPGPGGPRVWMGHFVDSQRVAMGFFEGGAPTPLRTVAMAMRSTPIGDGLAIGRVYGDVPGSDGELRFAPDLARAEQDRVLPSLRGVRALLAADLDGDGREELVVGDGWHQAYGQQADPRVRVLTGADLGEGRTVAWLEGNHSVAELSREPGASPSPALLATGNQSAFLLQRDALGWRAELLGPVAEGGNAVWARAEGEAGVLLSGQPARFVPLAGARW
jgi:hypothetical protein